LGALLTRTLATDYSLSLLDQREADPSRSLRYLQIDLSQKGSLSGRLSTFDTIVHLAGIPTADASWDDLFTSNVLGTQYLLEAALEQGSRRVILASTVQVMDGYPRGTNITPDMPVRPMNLYAISKVCAEITAARFGTRSPLSVFCLRLGWVLPRTDWRVTPFSPYLDRILTPGDFVRAVRAAIDAPTAVHFGVFHVLSDNRIKRLNIDDSRTVLGYAPRDDAYRLAWRNVYGMAVRIGLRIRQWKKKVGGEEGHPESTKRGGE
jgi:nucleoside-diphosphate-sugar epimerase